MLYVKKLQLFSSPPSQLLDICVFYYFNRFDQYFITVYYIDTYIIIIFIIIILLNITIP